MHTVQLQLVIIQPHSTAPYSIKRISEYVPFLFFLPIIKKERKFRQYDPTGREQTNSLTVE